MSQSVEQDPHIHHHHTTCREGRRILGLELSFLFFVFFIDTRERLRHFSNSKNLLRIIKTKGEGASRIFRSLGVASVPRLSEDEVNRIMR